MITNVTPHIISFFKVQKDLTGLFFLSQVDLKSLQKRIEEHEGIVDTYLCSLEQTEFARYTYPKRRYEWLGGRIAVKHAAINLSAEETVSSIDQKKIWKNLQVCHDKDKRPYLRSSQTGQALPHISISHSHGFALGMAANCKCGVDIQKITESITRVQSRFVTLQEQQLLSSIVSHPADARGLLTMLWSAKEAIKKSSHIQPVPGFLEITLLDIQKEDGYRFHLVFKRDKNTMKTFYDVYAIQNDDSIIALTLNQKASSCST